jgi:small subunit ribosomal protein S15
VENIKFDTKKLLETFKMHESDTGSSEYQIIKLTEKIKYISEHHLSTHKKDHPVKRSIVKWVSQRKKHQSYLAKHNQDKYAKLIVALGLRR